MASSAIPTDPISLEPLKAPVRLLPCGHSINHNSLTQLLSDAHGKEQDYIECPFDRKRSRIQFASDYPRNIALEQQIAAQETYVYNLFERFEKEIFDYGLKVVEDKEHCIYNSLCQIKMQIEKNIAQRFQEATDISLGKKKLDEVLIKLACRYSSNFKYKYDSEMCRKLYEFFSDIDNGLTLVLVPLFKTTLKATASLPSFNNHNNQGVWARIATQPSQLIKPLESLKNTFNSLLNYYGDDKIFKPILAEMVMELLCIENVFKYENLLKPIYMYFKDLENGLDLLSKKFENYFKQYKSAEIVRERSDRSFITKLIKLWVDLTELINIHCEGNEIFHSSLEAGLPFFVHTIESYTTVDFDLGTLLAKYFDTFIHREGYKDDDMYEDISFTLPFKLLKHLQDVDSFKTEYQFLYGRRLLKNLESSGNELSFISRLTIGLGMRTTKLRGMNSDMERSRYMSKAEAAIEKRKIAKAIEKTKAYKAECSSPLFLNLLNNDINRLEHFLEPKIAPETGTNIEFTVSLGAAGYWPDFHLPSLRLRVPSEMATCISTFNDFYSSTNSSSHRKLSWSHYFDNCVIVAEMANGKYQLEVNGMQAAVLILFNNIDSTISFHEILQNVFPSNPSKKEKRCLKQILHSLCSRSDKILMQITESNRINETDSFKVNRDFQAKKGKICIPMSNVVNRHSERKRRYENDMYEIWSAAGIAEMKINKVLTYEGLRGKIVARVKRLRPSRKNPCSLSKSVFERFLKEMIRREFICDLGNDNYQYLP